MHFSTGTIVTTLVITGKYSTKPTPYQIASADGKFLTTTTKTVDKTSWRSDPFPAAFTTSKYVALFDGFEDTTLSSGITVTKTINIRLTYVSKPTTSTSTYSPLSYIITDDESSVDTVLAAYRASKTKSPVE